MHHVRGPCRMLHGCTSRHRLYRRSCCRYLYLVAVPIILVASCYTRTNVYDSSDMSTSPRYQRKIVDEEELRWVSERTLAFARFWKSHKYRNIAVYACIATRSAPVVSRLLWLTLGCPDAFYTELWSRAFDIRRVCI